MLGYLVSLNADYAIQGRRPRMEGLELYDTANASGAKLPAWLRMKTYSGLVLRGRQPLLVSARQYGRARGVVLVLRIAERFDKQVVARGGVSSATALVERGRGGV